MSTKEEIAQDESAVATVVMGSSRHNAGMRHVTDSVPLPRIGCCGWSEAQTQYFTHFPAIELQSTFYEPPSIALARQWRSRAPVPFHFCLKAWQLITHTPASPTYRKLKSKLSPAEHELVGSFRPTEQVLLAWERTAAVARALEAQVVLFQCPASFRPEPENLRNLKQFFSEIRREHLALAWEPRGDWPSDLVAALCQDLDLLYCLDPLASELTDDPTPYWRLHGKGGYGYRYSEDDLAELRQAWDKAVTMSSGPRYIFFNNVWMKQDALRFQQLLTHQG